MMTSRERVRAVLKHQVPDRVPIDLASNRMTGIQCWAYKSLRKALGLPDCRPRVFDLMQMLAEVDTDVIEAIGADVLPVYIDGMLPFELAPERWQPLTLFDGTEVLVPGDLRIYEDSNGDWLIRQDQKADGKIRGRMPKGGSYFDYEGDNNVPDEIAYPDLDTWTSPWQIPVLSEAVLDSVEKRAKLLHETTDKALFLNYFRGGMIQAFNVPTWLVSLVDNPTWATEYHRRQAEWHSKNLAKLLDRVAPYVEVVGISGNDWGTQKGEMFSPATFAEMYTPYVSQINQVAHDYGKPTWFHCCGSIRRFLPEFVKMGVDCLNPVQTTAANMDAQELKNEFGTDFVFWGGGINTQQTLPFGTTEDVRRETAERVRIFGAGGGFVFNPVHNIQKDCSGENLLAMYRTVMEVGRYR
jgi:hypothetical protein